MLGHLIRKEILDHISGLRFLILSAVGVLAIWLSLYDWYAYYLDRLRDYRFPQTHFTQGVTSKQLALTTYMLERSDEQVAIDKTIERPSQLAIGDQTGCDRVVDTAKGCFGEVAVCAAGEFGG